MVSAVEVGPVILGDKGKPEDTSHLNSAHVLRDGPHRAFGR